MSMRRCALPIVMLLVSALAPDNRAVRVLAQNSAGQIMVIKAGRLIDVRAGRVLTDRAMSSRESG